MAIESVEITRRGIDRLRTKEVRELKGDYLLRIFLVHIELLPQKIEWDRIIHTAHVSFKGLGIDPMLDIELIAKLFCLA